MNRDDTVTRSSVLVDQIDIADDPAAWEAAGFVVSADDTVDVGDITLRLLGRDGAARGVTGWTLASGDDPDARLTLAGGTLDGLPTRVAPPRSVTAAPDVGHPNGAIAVDHVVVGSPNRDRTLAAWRDALGLAARRHTSHELYGRPMEQSFLLLANTLVEVISRPDAAGDGPCVFWGLAFTVTDLDRTARALGPGLGRIRPAVQPGRRIASVRAEHVGVSVPVAFLSPRQPA